MSLLVIVNLALLPLRSVTAKLVPTIKVVSTALVSSLASTNVILSTIEFKLN